MVCRRLKLLKFEFDVDGGTGKYVVLSTDTAAGKEEAKNYILQRIIREKGSANNIYLVGASDLGQLDIIAPSVEIILRDYFLPPVVQTETPPLAMADVKKKRSRRKREPNEGNQTN